MKSTIRITFLVTSLILLSSEAYAEWEAGWIEYVDTFTADTGRWFIKDLGNDNCTRIVNGRYVFCAPISDWNNQGPSWASRPGDLDFDIEFTLSAAQARQDPYVGLLFGMEDFQNHFFWYINPQNGHYEYGKKMLGQELIYHRQTDSVPDEDKLKNRTNMHLKINRRGPLLELFQEDISVGKFPFEPFLGSKFGTGLRRNAFEVSMDNFIYRLTAPDLHWSQTIRVVGNINWPGDNDNPMTAYVGSGDQAFVSTKRTGANQHLEIEMADLKIIHGQTVGVSLQTTDGATLKVFCEDRCPCEGEPVGRKIHMATYSGNKETRRKSIDLPAETLSFTLTLDRKGDQFMGSYNLGTGPKLIGSLKWPKLSTEQTNTCYFGYTGAIDFVESPDHVEMTIKKMSF